MDWRTADGMGSCGQVVARWFVTSWSMSVGSSIVKEVSIAVGVLCGIGGVTDGVKEFRIPATFPSKWARNLSAGRREAKVVKSVWGLDTYALILDRF